ncbi:hypothetical protein Amsp01_040080 [Amycolatopsis sp. NBRC 101858]|uniref:tetratricopeptide repeat protein n=1 Tax=Amycolatopsis sp. NBRC 101858 TaxID=3032200 RepID=UPI0024A07189|nr:hypothetical protein Amsp01_040080 [Amycolatopsis sp. NBRC 101858]
MLGGLNRLDEALEHITSTLALFRGLGDEIRQAHSLDNLGRLTARLGDHATALGHCRTALEFHRKHDYRDGREAQRVQDHLDKPVRVRTP